MQIASFKHPYFTGEQVAIDLSTGNNDVIALVISSYLPDIGDSLQMGIKADYQEDGILVAFDETRHVRLGREIWRIEEHDGLMIRSDLNRFTGEIFLINEDQSMGLVGRDSILNLQIRSLELEPIFAFVNDSLEVDGGLNVDLIFNQLSSELSWDAHIENLVVDSVAVGKIENVGKDRDDILETDLSILSEAGHGMLSLRRDPNAFDYELKLANFDIKSATSLLNLDLWNSSAGGTINGAVEGRIDDQVYADGLLALDNVYVHNDTYGVSLKVDKDTLWFNQRELSFRELNVKDALNQQLTIDGRVTLTGGPEFDLDIQSEKFTVLNSTNNEVPVNGRVDIATNLRVSGDMDQLDVTGHINTLPNATINYTYKSNVTLDEISKEVNFVSFKEENQVSTADNKKKTKGSSQINWDVNVDIGRTDVYILLYETTRDYVQLVAEGNLLITKGIGNSPQLFGEISSTEGSIYYDAPMISDLNLKIASASAKWNGEYDNPMISFLGTQVFRISPNEINVGWDNKRERVPVTVYAIVDNTAIDDFSMHFDLRSNNGQVGNYLQSLPPETRESYAVNLLVFGKIDTDGQSGSNSLMEGVVSKLNEISRRNIKNAELSFFIDSQDVSESNSFSAVDKFGYSFSKGFFNKRVRVSLGGNLTFSDSDPASHQGMKLFNPLGSIQIDYILSQSPDISINAMRKDVYKGAIDGQVNESSLGVTYRKTYPNFFQIIRSKDKK